MMKIKLLLLMMIFFYCQATVLPADQEKSSNTPVKGQSTFIAVAEPLNPRFEFDPVIEGTVVSNDFIIKNAGNALLAITDVKTGCGCTTASYSKKIPPGKEGKVSIKGNTTGYGGKTFSKIIKVYTSAPDQRELKLYISGAVEKFAVISPNRIFLRGEVNEDIYSEVTITPVPKYPFTITESAPDKSLKDKVSFSVQKKEDTYVLFVKNLLKEKGRYYGKILLKTDSAVKPEISIAVSGYIKDKKVIN